MDSVTGNVFELNNHNAVDNAVDPSILMINNYNIYDVMNNHYNNVINVNVTNNNFNDTFIYDDHNYYDDDFNGDENNNGEDVVSPEVDDSNPSSSSSNTKKNNITNRNYLKNSKLSKKRRTPNHLHVKFHEVDDNRNENYHHNVNVNSNCSGNDESIANIGNNYNYDNNRNITTVTAIDHDTNNTNSTFTTTSTTAITTSSSSTTNPTSNTTTFSTTSTTNDDTSNMMSTAATVSTTTANDDDDDDSSSYMYHGRLWTEEMDQELCTLHSSYKSEKDWAQRITNVINIKFHTTLTSSHISKRWTQYLRPELSKRKVGLWSETEIKQLHELVFINSYESKNIKGMIVVHWENVALALNRRYYDCQNKWNTIKKSTLKGKIFIYVYIFYMYSR
jgi:hypothetical protein